MPKNSRICFTYFFFYFFFIRFYNIYNIWIINLFFYSLKCISLFNIFIGFFCMSICIIDDSFTRFNSLVLSGLVNMKQISFPKISVTNPISVT